MQVEDTIQFMADFYPSLFPTRKHALNHLFCTVGNGYEWIDGELVDNDDEYEQRYKLKKHIKKATFKNDTYWNKMSQLYIKLNKETGREIPPEYQFHWKTPDKQYWKLYNYPDDIKPDWKAAIEECKQLLEKDEIKV